MRKKTKRQPKKKIKVVSPSLRLHFKEDFYKIIDKDINRSYAIFMDEEKFKLQWVEKHDELDAGIIKLYHDLFFEKVKKTTCVQCILNRIYRIRKHFSRYVGR